MLAIEGATLSAVKRADDSDGLIVRFYEHLGTHGRARLKKLDATTARRTDLLERPLDEETLAVTKGELTLALRPFELVTLLLSR